MKTTKIAAVLSRKEITNICVIPAGEVSLTKGIKGLPAYIENTLKMNPCDPHTAFVFMNGSCKAAKVYVYDAGKPLILNQYWDGCKISDWPKTWEEVENFTFSQYFNALAASSEDLAKMR